MTEDEIMSLPPAERLQHYINHSRSLKQVHEKQKEEEKQKRREQKKREAFQKKQREDKFNLDPTKRPKWKISDRKIPQELGKRSYLPPGDIDSTTLYRTSHLLPRSYQIPAQPFLLTRNDGEFFPKTQDKLLTKSGKRILEQNTQVFTQEVERRRQEEMKPKKVQLGPRWQPGGAKIESFSVPPSDPHYYFEQDLRPKYLQDKPFLRTSRQGDFFGEFKY